MKRKFLISMIISFCLSALIGIVIFLIGDFDELQQRILVTTLNLGFFSLLGICCSALYEKNKNIISIVGLIVTVFSFLYSTCLIWDVFENIRSVIYQVEYDEYALYNNNNYILDYKILVSLIMTSIVLAQASLLLLINNTKKFVNVIVKTTIFIAFVASSIIMFLIWSEMDIDNYIYRLLGVFCILDVLGTIVSPILNKVCKAEIKKEPKVEISEELKV